MKSESGGGENVRAVFVVLVVVIVLALHAVAVMGQNVARGGGDEGAPPPPPAFARSAVSRSSGSTSRTATARTGRGITTRSTVGRGNAPVEGVPEQGETARLIYKLSTDADAADKFSRGLGSSAARASSAAARSPFVRTSSVKRVVPYSGKFEAEHAKWGLDLYYEAEVDLSGASTSTSRTSRVGAALSSLRSTPGVVLAEIEPEAKLLYSASGEPNDPRYGSQPSYAHIKLEDVWKYVNGNTIGTAEKIIVQVIDAGTQVDHPDMRDKLW